MYNICTIHIKQEETILRLFFELLKNTILHYYMMLSYCYIQNVPSRWMSVQLDVLSVGHLFSWTDSLHLTGHLLTRRSRRYVYA